MTEWEFTADVAKWITEILAKNARLPFSEAKCEQRGSGSAQRRDLTLLDKNQVVSLTGEVKLPFQKDGGSPYIESVVQDARKKAERAGKMAKLSAPEHLTQGEDLRLHLEGYFQEAKVVTADYETVFGEDHTGIGNRIPFYADRAVPHWQALINQIHDFDFSRLDYDVIGGIFEKLLSPTERRKYGQFYTRMGIRPRTLQRRASRTTSGKYLRILA